MRVGVYVDAFNLYYGARDRCGRSSPGWRWLDVRGLVSDVVARQATYDSQWMDAELDRVVYCTARISAKTNPSGHKDQDTYLRALIASGAVDDVEYGTYVSRVKMAPVATKDRKGRPVLVGPQWPLVVQDGLRQPVQSGTFLVSYLHTEEKGSDVNVATRMLIDVLRAEVDAVVMVSNDSDLKLPVTEAKALVPVGLINPGKGYPAMPGVPDEGVGHHWWHSLAQEEYRAHQLPASVGSSLRPEGW
ncbi:MAG: hypothetical protein JWN22_1390 [Nocardioides sp.]|jgi:hypothetical protein|nr:hypothetical protein [Nocardioides sp.]